MSALPITITTAGLQALVNAQNTGVSNVVIAALGVSPSQVAITAAATVIPGELKRLGAVAGLVTAEDTIYVSATDQTQDIYTVRTVALYLGDGTLFAAYSQPAPLVEKAGPAQAVLEASIKLSAPLAEVIEFEGGGWLNPPASETVAGVLRLATVDEALAGVNHSKAVTAKGLKAVTSAMMAAIQATLDQIALTLAGKSNNGHQHGAADVVSGTFNEARIPELPMTRIGGLIATLGEKAQALHSHTMAQVSGLSEALAGKASSIHQHVADDIVAGVLAVGRIPALGMEKITGLAVALAGKAGLGEAVRFASVGLGIGRGLLYGDSNRVVVRAGAANAECYFGFNDDGSFQAYNGNVHSQHGRVWDPQNFNPDAKANLASPDFTGSVRLPSNSVIKKEGAGTGEGGQLVLEKPDFSNLGSNVAIDIQGSSLRVWEMGGAFKGVAIDLSLMPGPGTPILTAVDLATGAEALSGVSPSKVITPAALWSFAKSIGPSGYAQIPGTPIIMQWGSSSASLIEGQVTALLPIAFGGGCFYAAATPRNANGDAWADFMMQVVAKYLDRITFYAQRGYDGRNTSSGFEWLALGFATGTPNAVYSVGGGGTGGGGGGGGGELNPEL